MAAVQQWLQPGRKALSLASAEEMQKAEARAYNEALLDYQLSWSEHNYHNRDTTRKPQILHTHWTEEDYECAVAAIHRSDDHHNKYLGGVD